MTPAIAALSAAFLLTGTALAQSQGTSDPVGETEATATGTTVSPPSKRPQTRPGDDDRLRDQLLRGAIDVLLKPRPRPKPAEAPPAPVEPAVIPAAPAPSPNPVDAPVEPSPPAIPPAPAALPRDPVKPVPPRSPAAIEPAAPAVPTPAVATPAPRAAPAPAPLPEPVEVAAPAEARVVNAPPPVALEAAQPPILAPEPTGPVRSSFWWLAVLLAAAAVAAAAVHARRTWQISRTRALLSLTPSLDPLAGASSVSGLSLAGPPLTIRARLDMGGALNG